MADNTIANAIKFLKGEEKSLPATKTEGQVYFAYKNVGTAEKPSYTGAIYIDTPIGGTQTRVKMTANADVADKAFNDSAGLNIRETYLSSLGYTDDGKQTILIKGSGNNQTRIALPIASTTKSGIVTTDAQSFGGTKTFTTINSTNLTVTGSGSFYYRGIGSGTVDVARPVWFADNSTNGKPVVNTNFTYNPATQTLSVANLSGTADKANKDSGGQNIRNTYVKYKTIKFSATTDKVYLLEGNGAGSATATSGENISTAIIPAATDKAAGVITTGTQTFSGEKKFNNVIFVNDCLVGNPMKGTDITKLILLSVPNTNIGDTSYTTSVYFKALLKWICQNYPNKVNYTFIGRVNPNSAANASIYIYNTGKVDATSGLPEYSSGSYVQLQGNVYTFGTYQYAFYFRESLMSDSNYAGSASSGGAATSANKLNTNAGSAILPVYFSNGVPVVCSTNLGVSITGNAASATKLTSSAGSATQPIYFKDGKPVATTYSLNATVKAGVSNRIAFYSGNNEISSASSLKYYTTTNNKKAIQTILRIWGSTYGNDINTTISGKASSLSWNDGGPQIQFSTSEAGAKDGALIFTDHDSAGIGASFHFVSNQSEWSVVSKRFVAKTSVIIGQENHTANNQGYNLYVNGTEYINGILTAVGDCKFIAHGNEFNFVPTLKASTSVWFNYRQTGGQPTDGDFIINEYIFGNGANKALASIKEGLFSGAATYVRDSNNKTNNISVTYSKAGQASTSWLASWNEYELGRISPANITAGKATKLATARTITLSGAVTGSVSFDGSANVTLTTSVNHTHSQYYDSNISRTKNTVLAAPNGADGKAVFRSLVAADIPTLTKSKISDFPTSMPASDVYAWAKASTKPSYSWGEITGKPSTFTPGSHTHYSLSTIGNQRSIATTPNSYSNTFVFQGLKNNSTIGINNADTYSYVLGLRGWSDATGGDSHELAFNGVLGILTRNGSTTTWNAWRRILDSSNYIEYTVTKSGSGASGTWGINVTGSAGSVAWGNVTGKPSSFTPASHTHPYLPLAGGTMTGTINFTTNKLACMFGGSTSAYYSGVMHQNFGNEAIVFAATNSVTSFIFKCGQNPTSMANNTWANITPSMQIKQQSVYINSLIANDVTPSYNLYVNGTTRCNGTLGVGNGSNAQIDFFSNSSSTIGARIKAYNDRIEFVFS